MVGGKGETMDVLARFFSEAASAIALAVDAGSVLIILLGSLKALFRTLVAYARPSTTLATKKEIWTHYATTIILSLEFLLAADIIRTAIAPTWADIGQLAAIAALRTFLNYFLDKDIEKARAGSAAL
jgi:uncharacterized membrane protein